MKEQKQRKLAPNHGQKLLHGVDGSFVGCCDGITYGVDASGFPFHTSTAKWSRESIMRWAAANAEFYKNVAEKLAAFGKAVEDKVMPNTEMY